jgi:hypothetical protein
MDRRFDLAVDFHYCQIFSGTEKRTKNIVLGDVERENDFGIPLSIGVGVP